MRANDAGLIAPKLNRSKKAQGRLGTRERNGAGNGYMHEIMECGCGAIEEVGGMCCHASARACDFDERPGNDGVRHPRRRARRDCYLSDYGFPPSPARIMERDRGRHKRVVGSIACARGQSTVEFAVVTAGFLSATVALSLLWHAFGDGMLVEHALAVASHHIQAVFPTVLADIFLY